jgi:hypothetical protein
MCGRMNHYIIGEVGDGDSGEDDRDEQRGARVAAAAARGTPPPPTSWGSTAPFLHGFMGALPHRDGIHGGGENVALVAANSWVEVSPTS